MRKRIIDIHPPKPSAAFQEEKPSLTGKKISLPKTFEKKRRRAPLSCRHAWWRIIALFLILAGFFTYFTPPHLWGGATIEIWPETEVKTFQTKLTVDKKAVTPDFAVALLPGRIFEKEKTFSEEFFSSGKAIKEKKAEGIIRIYNDYQYSQPLIKDTRFQAPLEKFQPSLNQEKDEYPWFRTLEVVTVPANSFRDVKVVADSPGEKYNIAASTFSVPGLAGTPQYTFVYGKSSDPMKGGLKQELPSVTEEDLQKAKDTLTEKAKKEIEDLLKSDIPSELVFLEGALETKILETFSLAKAGMEVEKFNYQLKARATSLFFKKEDIENFVQSFITSQISDYIPPTAVLPEGRAQGKKIYLPSLKIDYSPEDINLKAGKIILNLEMKAKIYSAIDEISLKQGLAQKSLTEAQISLESHHLITGVKIKLWPFWLTRIPKDLEKIKIELRVDPHTNP